MAAKQVDDSSYLRRVPGSTSFGPLKIEPSVNVDSGSKVRALNHRRSGQKLAGAAVTPNPAQLRQLLAAQNDGMARGAAVGGPCSSRGRKEATNHGRSDARRISKQDDNSLHGAQRSCSVFQGRRHPIAPIWADQSLCTPEVESGDDRLSVRAEHDDDPLEFVYSTRGRYRVLQERQAVQLR